MIVILGPTASGKTRYAVKMACKCDGEILSADSRQVYRGMDIGTGKDLSEYHCCGRDIPYHLIDIAEAGTKYNLFEYQRDFFKAFEDIHSRGKQPILCGGTGLYIEAVTKGYSLPEVPIDFQLREEFEKLSLKELAKKLTSVKRLHNTTDIDHKKRAIRALEIALYAEKHPTGFTEYPKLKCRYIGILVEREERNRRIDIRLKQRLENGLVEEVKGLITNGIPPEKLIYYGLEYKFVTLYLTGQLSYKEMTEQLAIAIHQFAKRQMTWFRGMERRGVEIEWITNIVY